MDVGEFLATPRSNVVSSVLTFPIIDTEGMIRSLRLRDRALEAGKSNLPGKDSESFDAAEQDIVKEIGAEGQKCFVDYLEHQKTYADRARDTGMEAALVQLGAAADAAIADFDRETRTGTDILYKLKRQVADAERDLEKFRNDHGLSRPVWHQQTLVSVIGTLIFILAIEGALNGHFLAKGSEFGFVGGFLDAIVIAAVNVAVGFIVGWKILPWTLFRVLPIRIVAALAFCAYLALAVYFNLGVAHYRIAMATDPFNASAKAFQFLLSAPLSIHDFQSWLLFGMGFIFSLTAVYEGWKTDDPYPGYGKRYRQSQDALATYSEIKDDLFNTLETIKIEAEEKLEDAARSLSSRDSERNHVAAKSYALRAAIEEHFSHLQAAGRTLLQYYRSENIRMRSDPASVPRRFDVPWIYVRPNLDEIGIVVRTPEEVANRIRRALEDAPTKRKELHGAYTQAKDKYLQIEDIVGRNQ